LARQPGGVGIRKLVPAYPMTVNGQAATTTALADGDRVRLGPVELVLHLSVSPHDHAPPESARQEIETIRRGFAALRQHLCERYRQRRDRLAGLQEAVNRAAAKVQERKRALDAEVQDAAVRHAESQVRAQELDRREQELQVQGRAQTEELDQTRQRLEEERRIFEEQKAACTLQEHQLEESRQALERQQAQYQADLVRLDRQGAGLEERQQRLQERERGIEQRF